MTYAGMKREREDNLSTIATTANYLMLISRSRVDSPATSLSRVFECNTCNRQFPSFQALGGHRASHKKPKLVGGDLKDSGSPPKPKKHECSICGIEFSIGQALGGHMRRHRASMSKDDDKNDLPLLSLSSSSSSKTSTSTQVVPVVKKSNSRRVLCLDLNLNTLPPDDFDFPTEKVTSPIFHCYL